MTALMAITLISAAAVTFLLRFLIALRNETTERTGRVERISPAAVRRNRNGKVLSMRASTARTQTACGRR